MINYYHGNQLVLVNREATPFDHQADLRIQGSIGRSSANYPKPRSSGKPHDEPTLAKQKRPCSPRRIKMSAQK